MSECEEIELQKIRERVRLKKKFTIAKSIFLRQKKEELIKADQKNILIIPQSSINEH